MIIQAKANQDQLLAADVTISTTMRLSQWKSIRDAMLRDAKSNNNWTNMEFESALSGIISNYENQLTQEFKASKIQ